MTKGLRDWQNDKNLKGKRLSKKQLREIKRINKIQKGTNFNDLDKK